MGEGNISGYDCNPCSLRREQDTVSLRHFGEHPLRNIILTMNETNPI